MTAPRRYWAGDGSAFTLRVLLDEVLRRDLPPHRLLAESGFNARDADNPFGRISRDALFRFAEGAATLTGDPAFHLDATAHAQIGAFGAADFVVTTAPTLGIGLSRVAAGYAVINLACASSRSSARARPACASAPSTSPSPTRSTSRRSPSPPPRAPAAPPTARPAPSASPAPAPTAATAPASSPSSRARSTTTPTKTPSSSTARPGTRDRPPPTPRSRPCSRSSPSRSSPRWSRPHRSPPRSRVSSKNASPTVASMPPRSRPS